MVCSGPGANSLTISGTNLGSSVTVLVGEESCNVTSSSDTTILCDIDLESRGHHGVKVIVKNVGLAEQTLSYEYESEVTSVSPTSGHKSGEYDQDANIKIVTSAT